MPEFTYPIAEHQNKRRCVDCKWAEPLGQKTVKDRGPAVQLMEQFFCRHDDKPFALEQNKRHTIETCARWDALPD
jgi:hypothetical protein